MFPSVSHHFSFAVRTHGAKETAVALENKQAHESSYGSSRSIGQLLRFELPKSTIETEQGC